MYVGKAYASELAKRGLNIVLVSRTPHKLQNVAAEITEKYKVRTKIVDIDFTTEKEVYERIVKETDGLEVGPAFPFLSLNFSRTQRYPLPVTQPKASFTMYSFLHCKTLLCYCTTGWGSGQ